MNNSIMQRIRGGLLRIIVLPILFPAAQALAGTVPVPGPETTTAYASLDFRAKITEDAKTGIIEARLSALIQPGINFDGTLGGGLYIVNNGLELAGIQEPNWIIFVPPGAVNRKLDGPQARLEGARAVLQLEPPPGLPPNPPPPLPPNPEPPLITDTTTTDTTTSDGTTGGTEPLWDLTGAIVSLRTTVLDPVFVGDPGHAKVYIELDPALAPEPLVLPGPRVLSLFARESVRVITGNDSGTAVTISLSSEAERTGPLAIPEPGVTELAELDFSSSAVRDANTGLVEVHYDAKAALAAGRTADESDPVRAACPIWILFDPSDTSPSPVGGMEPAWQCQIPGAVNGQRLDAAGILASGTRCLVVDRLGLNPDIDITGAMQSMTLQLDTPAQGTSVRMRLDLTLDEALAPITGLLPLSIGTQEQLFVVGDDGSAADLITRMRVHAVSAGP